MLTQLANSGKCDFPKITEYDIHTSKYGQIGASFEERWNL